MLDTFSIADLAQPFVGLVVGGAVTAAVMLSRQIGLERANAALSIELKAQQNALQQAGEALDARFKASAQEALDQSNSQFIRIAQEKLRASQKDGQHDLDKRQRAIDELIKPVREKLDSLDKALQQVKGTDRDLRDQMQLLNKETARLVGALKDPAAQGKWGEFILEGLMENSGLIKGVHYETQVSLDSAGGRQRPDAVIHLQDGLKIVIDAKAPINEFTQRLSDNLSEIQHDELRSKIARQVREHVKELSKKNYWESLEGVDFTVLFLPSEQLYSLALRADPEIVNFAAERNIIIASPTLLMSLLRVVGMNWRQIELAQNAQEISERGYELYKRLLKFTDHLQKAGKNIGAALRSYNDAIGSFERNVLPSARKFKDLQGSASQVSDIAIADQMDDSARHLKLAHEDDIEKGLSE